MKEPYVSAGNSVAMKRTQFLLSLCSLALLSPASVRAADLARPDGKPADLSKPVKVFIVMGQSNTLEMGAVKGDKDGALEKAVKSENLYPFLVDDAGAWTTRMDVRNVSVMQKGDNMNVYRNDWLTISGNKIGIEIGIGHHLGQALDEPVMVLKSSIGNRGLAWDLLPPGSERYLWEMTDKAGNKTQKVMAGYKDKPDMWDADPAKGLATPPPAEWLDKKGKPIDWYAGKQYDDDVANAKKVLADLGKYYPEATKYEIAGFIWWQGEKDAGNDAHSANYEKNLVTLIKALRKEFDAPNAKFVMGTIGEVTKEATGNSRKILDAMFAVDGESGKYPEFKGNVATIYTYPYSQGGSGNGHYSGNAKVYMDVGLLMGETMNRLLKAK
jgi:hypothetical protein